MRGLLTLALALLLAGTVDAMKIETVPVRTLEGPVIEAELIINEHPYYERPQISWFPPNVRIVVHASQDRNFTEWVRPTLITNDGRTIAVGEAMLMSTGEHRWIDFNATFEDSATVYLVLLQVSEDLNTWVTADMRTVRAATLPPGDTGPSYPAPPQDWNQRTAPAPSVPPAIRIHTVNIGDVPVTEGNVTITPGPTNVSAVVQNVGPGRGIVNLMLRRGQDVVGTSQFVDIQPGQAVRVAFPVVIEHPGQYYLTATAKVEDSRVLLPVNVDFLIRVPMTNVTTPPPPPEPQVVQMDPLLLYGAAGVVVVALGLAAAAAKKKG